MSEVRYIHTENVHNFSAAGEVVPALIEMFGPKSVVDVGCGTGTWLKIFKDLGIADISGIDGSYVDRAMLHISESDFVEYDLEQPYAAPRRYDMAISLEVAEHLKPESADTFVRTLVSLSDVVVFSAATANQGGQNHLNEQPPLYWIEKFADQGYKCWDVLRPIFWENPNVDAWYRQNTMVFTKGGAWDSKLGAMPDFGGRHFVHPEILSVHSGLNHYLTDQIERFETGKKPGAFYWNNLVRKVKKKFS